MKTKIRNIKNANEKLFYRERKHKIAEEMANNKT